MTNKMEVQGIEISTKDSNKITYISLTDIAKMKNPSDPRFVVINWMRSKEIISFLGLWEILNNPDFNRVEFETVRDKEAGYNAFSISPSQWIERTDAIGLVSSSGRHNSGTFAHPDIAMEFASWVSVEFKLYLIKEFQRLKIQEQTQLEWSAKRELAKINYVIHTDAIKEKLMVADLKKEQINYVYANEADMLNVALFGTTASQWSKNNPDKKGNMRDYASVDQLLVLANLESYNAILIEQGLKQSERIILLNKTAKKQLETMLLSKKNIENVTKGLINKSAKK